MGILKFVVKGNGCQHNIAHTETKTNKTEKHGDYLLSRFIVKHSILFYLISRGIILADSVKFFNTPVTDWQHFENIRNFFLLLKQTVISLPLYLCQYILAKNGNSCMMDIFRFENRLRIVCCMRN
jgi:hypothetical protein